MINYLDSNFDAVKKQYIKNINRIEWTYTKPKFYIKVKDIIDNALNCMQESTFSRLFQVIPTRCEYYNGNCWTRLDKNYTVVSNIMGRNDIEIFYDCLVEKVVYSDEWGHISIDMYIER